MRACFLLPMAASLCLATATAQITLFKDIDPNGGSAPREFVDAYGTMFFAANDGSTGFELWKSNGTASGTVLLKDIEPGSSSSQPEDLTVVGERVFFTAETTGTGREPWVTDGTANGTVLLKDINPGTSTSVPEWLTALGNLLIFVAYDPAVGTHEIWRSDGTSQGTVLVRKIWQDNASPIPRPQYLVRNGNRVYFQATDGLSSIYSGEELWATDGTLAGTVMVADIAAGATGSKPKFLEACCGTIYFSADDGGAAGREPWISDGTAAGTTMLGDLGPGDSRPQKFTCCRDSVFFVADTVIGPSSTGLELWVTDGTAMGTTFLRDIWPGSLSSDIGEITCCDNRVFFRARDGTTGYEPWVSDGTPAGTVKARDLNSGTLGSAPKNFTAVGRRAYFSANTLQNGRELWVSDGTSGGTTLVQDLWAGGAPNSSWPEHLAVFQGRLFFQANDGSAKGTEMWVVDRPGASVVTVGQPCGAASPQLDATSPLLGATTVLSHCVVPTSGVGVVLLGAPLGLGSLLQWQTGCYLYYNPFTAITLGTVTAPPWTLGLPIPNDPGLEGVVFALQTVWLADASQQTTNAVYIAAGSK